MSTPVFDHSKPCSLHFSSKGKYLEQGGHLFTYGEWNRLKKRFEPEPKWVDPTKISDPDLYDMLSAMLFKMSQLMDQLSEMQTAIINNMEKFLQQRRVVNNQNVAEWSVKEEDDVTEVQEDGEQDEGGDQGADLPVLPADKSDSKGNAGKQRNRSSRRKNK